MGTMHPKFSPMAMAKARERAARRIEARPAIDARAQARRRARARAILAFAITASARE